MSGGMSVVHPLQRCQVAMDGVWMWPGMECSHGWRVEVASAQGRSVRCGANAILQEGGGEGGGRGV